MNKSKKMKLSYVTVLGLFSCNNENEILNSAKENQLPEVEVSNLSAWSNSPQFNYSNKVIGPRSGVCILNLPPEKVGKTFDSTVKNFQSGKCGDARGNQTFKNITVM